MIVGGLCDDVSFRKAPAAFFRVSGLVTGARGGVCLPFIARRCLAAERGVVLTGDVFDGRSLHKLLFRRLPGFFTLRTPFRRVGVMSFPCDDADVEDAADCKEVNEDRDSFGSLVVTVVVEPRDFPDRRACIRSIPCRGDRSFIARWNFPSDTNLLACVAWYGVRGTNRR